MTFPAEDSDDVLPLAERKQGTCAKHHQQSEAKEQERRQDFGSLESDIAMFD